MDRKRLWEGKGLKFGILLAFVAFCLGGAVPELKKGEPLSAGTFLEIVNGSFSSKSFLFLLPVASVLPFGDAYLQDRQQGFLKFLLVRRGRAEYVRDKVVTMTAGGAIVWIVAGGLAVLLSFVIFFPMESRGAFGWAVVGKLLLLLLRTCLVGSILANISGLLSAVTGSYYMAFGLPFVIYYLLIILYERYLPWVYVIDPAGWLSGKGSWGAGGLGLYLFLLLCLCILIAAHGAALEEKLQEK
ncbi:MAG: hypothetical protein ACOYBE_05810 [Blautia sp.]|jgi:hypothetical protein